MKRNRSLSLLLLCALVLALLAGCGGRAASGGKDSYTETEAEEAYDAGMTSTENTAAPASPASGDGEGSGAPLPGGLKLVYTGSVTIDSTDYDATVADVRKLIADYGCLVEQANESDYDRTWRDSASSVREHTWTLRVPSEKFSALLESFGTVHGHVSDKNQSARDMTKQYRDNESRIASLKAQETRLLAFMDQAASISELMEVEDRLSEVRYELEQLQNDNNTIDQMANWSTLTVRVSEVAAYSGDGLSFPQRVAQAWSTSGTGFVRAVQGIVIAVIWLLPWLVIAGVVVLILYLTRNKRAVRREARREAKRLKAEALRRKRMMEQSPPPADQGTRPQ